MDTGLSRRIGRLRRRWNIRIKKRQARWLDKRIPSVSSLQLGQRSIFILPSWQGMMFSLGAIIILIIAVAERNPFAIFLSALLLSLFILSLVLCYRNLSGLQLSALEDNFPLNRQRGFLGEKADFKIDISSSDSRRKYHDVRMGFHGREQQSISLTAGDRATVLLSDSPVERGIFYAPRMMLETRYPAGLWRAWSRPRLHMPHLVYPKPSVCRLPETRRQFCGSTPGQNTVARQPGMDDFTGLRSYYPGDNRRRIAWHVLARGQGLKTKQFVREDDSPLMLSPAMFADLDMEAALSCLTYQVVRLSRQGRQQVGLRLPGCKPIAPGEGEAHKHIMLQALALWE